MIIINLLPEELRPIKRTPLPHILSVLTLLLALAAMGWMYISIAGEINGKRQELATANAELDGLRDVVIKYNELSEQKQQLESKIGVIQEILSDRILWSEQLHKLAELTPENFWYKRIRETSKTVRVERVELDPKTGQEVKDKDGKVKYVRENVKRPVLEISGYVINNEQGSNRITPLTYNTTQDEQFAKLFVLDSPQIIDDEYNGYSVRGFVLEYNIMTGEDR